MQIETIYSTPAAESLARLLETEYSPEGPVTCKLLRRGFNDHYVVTAGESRSLLRVYHARKHWVHGEGDIRFELELLSHLREHGVGVACAIPRRSGELLGRLEAPEGTRRYALFEYAPGGPAGDFTADGCRAMGELMARLHVAADRFTTAHTRFSLDADWLIDLPLRSLAPYLHRLSPDDAAYVQAAGARIKDELAAVALEPGVWGIVHGDLHGGNCHIAADGTVTLFDFDHCGYGWRAYDLSCFLCLRSEAERAACLEGYEAVRPLTESERAALPAFYKARLFWDNLDLLAFVHMWGDGWVTEKWLGNMVKSLRELEEKPSGA